MERITPVWLYSKVNVEELKDNLSKTECKYKQIILEYLKNLNFRTAYTTERVFDFVKNKETDIPMVAYEDEKYYWDDREIYYFEKYNLKLNDNFIQYVIKKMEDIK